MKLSFAALLAAGSLAALSPAEAKTYQYRSYDQMVSAMRDLARRYPDIVQVSDAQSKYRLGSAGSCGSEQCKQYYVQLGKRSMFDQDTPEVFFAGTLHGNERVGPQVAMEYLIYLAESYKGVGPAANNPWIKRLIETRSVWVMPMTNALG